MLGLIVVLTDTPANCMQDQFYGEWKVELSEDAYRVSHDQVVCPSSYNVSETVVFVL